MEKLNKIIKQLDEEIFLEIENELEKNNSKKFLYLFKSYRNEKINDANVLASLNCNENALYVLKSRLYDRVQKHLTKSGKNDNKSLLYEKTNYTTQLLYEYPRETAIAVLHELEKRYTENDVPGELIDIYSALKKAYYHTDKYYLYSQLYNKQVACYIANEKAEDILFNFNKVLSNYFFSRSENDKDLIQILKKEIVNVFALNQSHLIELYKNIISIQIILFTNIETGEEEPVEDLIKSCEKIIHNFPTDKKASYLKTVIDFFNFEYYQKIGQLKKAQQYLILVNSKAKTWMLLNNVCLAYKFLLSKICFLVNSGQKDNLGKGREEFYFDNDDFFTVVVLKLYNGLAKFYEGKLKEGSNILNDILNKSSLKDFFHMEIEIKLTLAYFYIKQNEFELAENQYKSVARKISDNKNENYSNAKVFIKLLTLLSTQPMTVAVNAKIKEAVEKFNFHNARGERILEFLNVEINAL